MIGEGFVDHLSVQRWYAAPPELVYRAFTERELLERWFCPSPDVSLTVTHLDVRVGGTYRFVFRFPDDRVAAVTGEYQSLSPPGGLSFTWTWEPPDPHAGVETLVTIHFTDRDGGTDLALTHARFPTEPLTQQHENGWRATLQRLDALMRLG